MENSILGWGLSGVSTKNDDFNVPKVPLSMSFNFPGGQTRNTSSAVSLYPVTGYLTQNEKLPF